MTDEPLSTTITETATVSGAGMVNTPDPAAPEPEAKPSSIRDTLNAEIKAAREADKAKPEAAPEKPKDEAKPDAKAPAEPPKSDPKPAGADSGEAKEAPAQPEEGDVSSEGKKPTDPAARTKYDNPPEKVAHHARAKWANVPVELKAEFHRIVEAQDSETRQYQEDRQFRESLREYDDLAKKAGTTVDKAMARYVDIDRRLSSGDDNTRATTMLELMQSSRVDPVKFAEAILQNREQFQGQGQQRPDPMVAQMSQQLQQLTAKLEQQEQQQRAVPVMQTVEQFAMSKPDYAELENDIADLLNTGIIQKRFPGLAPDQLLAEAYRRAGGAYPTSQPDTQAAPQDPPAVEEPPRPVNPDAGRKSISGAPTGGKTPIDRSQAKSLRELLAEETRKKRA